MRKCTALVILSMGLLALTANGQQMAKKFVLYEHFTQASCGPCAVQNPIFDENILGPNPGKIHHIAYHTYWPGRDPMYDHNTVDSRARTTFYGINSVPDIVMLGNKAKGNPGSFTQQQLNREIAQGSPIAVQVSESEDSDNNTRVVNVSVLTFGDVPAGAYRLRVAIVEHEIRYDQAPGSNGEKVFPNVFRKMLPDNFGEVYTPAAKGEAVDFEFSYDMHPDWNPDEIYVIAFVQHETTKEVINSGSSRNSNTLITSPDAVVKRSEEGKQSLFDMQVTNYGASDEEFRIAVQSDKPENWGVFFDLQGTRYDKEATLTVAAGSSLDLSVCVIPGADAAVTNVRLSMQSLDRPQTFAEIQDITVISGITDLLVSNTEDWEPNYIEALDNTGSRSHAGVSTDVFVNAGQSGALDGIDNIYYNISWTFPALTDDRVEQLRSFIDRGGNLFIAGQDIAWDQSGDSRANGTAQTRAFFSDYLQAEYVADGDGQSSTLTSIEGEPLFSELPDASIVDVFNGNFYPDVIKTIGAAQPIFRYNNEENKVAGLRAFRGQAKIVYLGIGLEMLSDISIRDRIIDISRKWFNGSVTSAEFDDAISGRHLGHNYPNPAAYSTSIPLNNVTRSLELRIVDAQGKTLQRIDVAAGATSVNVDTRMLGTGVYLYQLYDGGTLLDTRALEILR